MPESNVDWNSGESWTIARRYADFLKPIPPSVSDAIRTLWRNIIDNTDATEPEIYTKSFDVVARVDKTAVIKTPLYFAALDLFEEKFDSIQEDDTSRALLQILGLGMFGNLLGLIYLHRRLNKLNSSDLWGELSKEYALNMQLGFLIGEEISGIGGDVGLLVGGIRYAALGAMLKHSPEDFARYRNACSGQLDRGWEHARWGCDHAQIAAILIKILGMDVDILQCANALRTEIDLNKDIPSYLVSWRAATSLVEMAFKKQAPTEEQLHQAGLEVDSSAIAQLFSFLETYVDGGTSFDWMFRSAKPSQLEAEPSYEEDDE